MANTGDTLVRSGADAGGGGSAWSSPGNITANDSTPALVALSPFSSYSNYLYGYNMGFSIPSGATINGIEVKIKAQAVALGPYINSIRVVHPTLGSGYEKANYDTLSTSYATYTYGGQNDLHGLIWTYSNINNSNFGAKLSVNNGGSTTFVWCDCMWINVYYSTGGEKFCQTVSIL